MTISNIFSKCFWRCQNVFELTYIRDLHIFETSRCIKFIKILTLKSVQPSSTQVYFNLNSKQDWVALVSNHIEWRLIEVVVKSSRMSLTSFRGQFNTFLMVDNNDFVTFVWFLPFVFTFWDHFDFLFTHFFMFLFLFLGVILSLFWALSN